LFIAEIKRYGEWEAVTPATGIFKAIGKGKEKVETTLGASLRVRKVGTDEFVKLKETRKFRKGKTDPFALVQKRSYRLSKKGEKEEIQAAKRKRRIIR